MGIEDDTGRARPRELVAHAARLHAVVERLVVPVLAEHGLTRSEFDVLASLASDRGSQSGARPSRLSATLLLTSGGVSNVLRRLESADLVVRSPTDVDRRGQHVRLTPRGSRVLSAADAAVERVIADALAAAPDGAIRSGSDALHDVLTALGNDLPVHRALVGPPPDDPDSAER